MRVGTMFGEYDMDAIDFGMGKRKKKQGVAKVSLPKPKHKGCYGED